MIGQQIIAGPPLRQNKSKRRAVDLLAFARNEVRVGIGKIERCDGVVEINAEPRP